MNVAPSIAPRRTLGGSDVTVSALGLGGGGLGNLYQAISDDAALATIARALESGMRFIDTAPFYGFGLSERRVGQALRAWTGERIALSTKVGRLLVPTPPVPPGTMRHSFISSEPFEPVYDYSYDGVLHSHEESLRRLGVDRIDVLLCHDLGRRAHGDAHPARLKEFLEGGYRAMRRLREEGTVGAIGLGVNECEICIEVLASCELDCLLLAGRYTLLEQGALAELLPLCARRNVSVIVGGPFNSGILAMDAAAGGATYDYRAAPRAIIERVERIAAVCRAFNVALPCAALQFPLAHPQIAAVIPGCSSPEQAQRVVAWFNTRIPVEFWDALRSADLLDRAAPVPA